MTDELRKDIISRYKLWYEDNSKGIDDRVKEAYKKINAFLKKFTIEKILKMDKDQYIEGKGNHDTFCYWVENKLNDSGNIHGATSEKFGLYYSGKNGRYITSTKFNSDADKALAEIKIEIIELINASNAYDLDKIDSSKLSNMFRHKIVFLYNRENYLPVFSEDHVNKLIVLFELPFDKKESIARKKDKLMSFFKSLNLSNCSPLKFMFFVYDYSLGFGHELKEEEFKSFLRKTKKDIEIEDVENLEDLFKEKNLKDRKSVYKDNPGKEFQKKLAGKKGEELAFNYFEKNKKKLGITDIKYYCLNDRPEANDLMGCDIEYITQDGIHHFVEIKSTSKNTPNKELFFMSDIEFNKLKENVNTYYVLYFNNVYDSDTAKRIPGSLLVGYEHPVKFTFDLKEIKN